jgi:2',3'-cyclic-nucleotide 2'-phosphodiesterase (5'-nucleotidase family)
MKIIFKNIHNLSGNILVAFMLLWTAVFSSCNKIETAPTLTILHFNDTYELEPPGDGRRGGAARAATVLKEYAEENPLILFSGDAISGSALTAPRQGQAMIEALNALGVQYATLGNHEFDFGPEVAAKRVKESNFTWLAANLIDTKTKKPLVGALPSVLTQWNGINVGLIGLVGNWLEDSSVGPNAKYDDYLERGRETAKKLKSQGADIVIALTHMDMKDDEILAAEVPEIDLVLGGHDHDPMHKSINGTLVWKSGSDWIQIGLIQVTLPRGSKPTFFAKLLPVSEQIKPNPEVANLISKYAKELESFLGEVLGVSKIELDTRVTSVRQKETPVGNLFTDAMREQTGADAALINGGGVRSNLVHAAGEITRKMLMTILPFQNKVITLELTGQQILGALENGVSEFETAGGSFPQVSGLDFRFNPKKSVGQRITKVTVGGKPLIVGKTYSFATLDFLANGGDGYDVLVKTKRITKPTDTVFLTDAITSYFKKNGPVAPKVEHRIVMETR